MEMIGTAIAFHRYSAQEDLEIKIQDCKETELGAIEFGWNLCTLGPVGRTNKKSSRKQLFFPSKEQVSLVLEKSKNFRRSIHAPYIISLTTDNKNILTSSKRYITRVSTLGDLLQALTEAKMLDSVVLDGSGIRRILGEDNPLFADWLKGTIVQHDYNNTILTPIDDKEEVKHLKLILDDYGFDFSDKKEGFLCLIPVLEDF